MSMFDLWDKAVIENETVILEDIDSMQYSFEDDSYELWVTLPFVFDGIGVDCDIQMNEDELMWVMVHPIIDDDTVSSHHITLRDGVRPKYITGE